MNNLSIVVNNQTVFEFDREGSFTEDKLAFLDKMDADMNRGIKIQGELIHDPDLRQRARFVVLNLVKALQQENQAIIQASCSYLVNRIPSLVQAEVNEEGGKIIIELVEEKPA